MVLAAVTAAVLSCGPGPSGPGSLASAERAAPNARVSGPITALAGHTAAGLAERGVSASRDRHCAPCPAERHDTHCDAHLPDGNLNSAFPLARGADRERATDSAAGVRGALHRPTGPPARAPDLHLLQLLRV